MSPPSRLHADRRVIDDDPEEFYELSMREAWGDGMPLLPPTEARVRKLLAATPLAPDHVVGSLPPVHNAATVELIAINAAMCGVAPEAFPFLLAALDAACAPEHSLYGLTTTTGSVLPMIIVNGPSRDRLGFDYREGCMGGAAGRGSATVGRALSLCLRNIGGQKVGVNSKSVFGQPARAAGLCFAEWEERSPWATVAEQMGHQRGVDVVTVHGGMGTHPMADINTSDARELLRLLAKSMAFPAGNKFLSPTAGNGQVVLAINPLWAERMGKVFATVESAKEYAFSEAWLPVELWADENRQILEAKNRIDAHGRVWLNERPDQFVFVVCGGLGNLHAICLPSWADSEIVSRSV